MEDASFLHLEAVGASRVVGRKTRPCCPDNCLQFTKYKVSCWYNLQKSGGHYSLTLEGYKYVYYLFMQALGVLVGWISSI